MKIWKRLLILVLFVWGLIFSAQADVCLLTDQDKCQELINPVISVEGGKDVCRGIREHREGSGWICGQCNGDEWCYCPDDMEIIGTECIYTPNNDKCGQAYQFTSDLQQTKVGEYKSLWECEECDDEYSQYKGRFKCNCPGVFDIEAYTCEEERCGASYSYDNGCPGSGYESEQCDQKGSLYYEKWRCDCDETTHEIDDNGDCVAIDDEEDEEIPPQPTDPCNGTWLWHTVSKKWTCAECTGSNGSSCTIDGTSGICCDYECVRGRSSCR